MIKGSQESRGYVQDQDNHLPTQVSDPNHADPLLSWL